MSFYNDDLDIIMGDTHDLLEPPAPAFSNLTVRRAFIVWMYSGQRNKFRDVCSYYHRLEALEETFSPEQRIISRRNELSLFINSPPNSAFLRRYFPELYSDIPVTDDYIFKLENIKNEKNIFKLEGFNEYIQTGISQKEINEVSKTVRHYCQTHFLTLRQFYYEFKQYTTRCGLKETVTNVADYIKRKNVRAELETIEFYPKTFSFLDSSDIIEHDQLPDEKPLESQQLKLLLGVTSKFNQDNANSNGIHSNYSSAEFFKLFKNKSLDNNVSYSNVPSAFEDFAKALDNNRYRSKSVEAVTKAVITNKSFKKNQDMYDKHMKVCELAKVREI